MNTPSLESIVSLSNEYVDRIISEGKDPAHARQLAMARAAQKLHAASNAPQDEIAILAGRVREGSETIVTLARTIAKKTGVGDGFAEAEKMLRQQPSSEPVEDTEVTRAMKSLGIAPSGEPNIVQLADRIQATKDVNREVAFDMALKQIQASR